jgi:hypothetical protein
MRRMCGARTAILAVVSLVLASPAAADAARRDCWPKGTKTLKQSEHARVYEVNRDDDGHPGTRKAFHLTVQYACLYSSGRRVQLRGEQDGEFQESYGPYRLADRYVAHLTEYLPIEPYDERDRLVEVIDLRTGRVRRDARAWVGDDLPHFPDEYPDPDLDELILTKAGYAAWISDEFKDREVWRLDSRGAKRLDRGGRPTSLRSAGGRVRWQNDGERKVASFR